MLGRVLAAAADTATLASLFGTKLRLFSVATCCCASSKSPALEEESGSTKGLALRFLAEHSTVTVGALIPDGVVGVESWSLSCSPLLCTAAISMGTTAGRQFVSIGIDAAASCCSTFYVEQRRRERIDWLLNINTIKRPHIKAAVWLSKSLSFEK